MRSLLLLVVLTVGGAWVVIRHLPHGEALASSTTTDPQVRSHEVVSVAIDQPGVAAREGLPLAELRRVLATRPGQLLDRGQLAADREALEDALAARGYRAAHVAEPTVVVGQGGGAYVVYDVTRGPMFRLGAVTVTGPGRDVAGVVTLTAGEDASRARLERARQSLVDTLSRQAASARVELVLREDPSTASLDVTLATH